MSYERYFCANKTNYSNLNIGLKKNSKQTFKQIKSLMIRLCNVLIMQLKIDELFTYL